MNEATFMLILFFELALGYQHISPPKIRDKLRKGFWNFPLQLNNDYHNVRSYENLQIRKHNRRSERFDENKMIFLTKPRSDSDRSFNKLINDIIELKTQNQLREKNRGIRSRVGRYGQMEFGFDQLVA